MKKTITCLMSVLILATYIGCSKEELPKGPIVDLGGEVWEKGKIDNWIDQQFVDPYNIEVKYKWDPYELNYTRNLIPISEEKVEPVMTAVKQIWIDPYEKIAGGTFIKTYSPKLFVLAGSSEYNDNGTEVLGQAEGGRKIVLLRLNRFEKGNKEEVQQLLHTIHHEFAHILHQTKRYPVEWKAFNPGAITATWFNSTDREANTQGLITAYSKASYDEDFVETIAFLLVYGQEKFDAVVNRADVPATAKQILRNKEIMVVDYFNRQFKIDFRKLQQQTQAAIAAY